MFLWQAALERIAVKENLVKRGLVIENEGRCCLCGLAVESTMHLMLHCHMICSYSINDFLQKFGDVKLKSVKARNRQNEWAPPRGGVLKFNVDGSTLGAPGRSGVGGLLRNSRRQILGVFSKPLGELWAYEAEVKAIISTF